MVKVRYKDPQGDTSKRRINVGRGTDVAELPPRLVGSAVRNAAARLRIQRERDVRADPAYRRRGFRGRRGDGRDDGGAEERGAPAHQDQAVASHVTRRLLT